jgi:hypothetical protein
MKKFSGYLIILLFSTNILFAQHFDMISTGDPILEDIRFLSMVSSRPFLSFSPPLSPAEVRNFIDLIDESTLSESGRLAYFRILKRLTPQAKLSSSYGVFTSFLNINSTVEARVRFNSEVNEYPQNPNITPFATFPVKLFFADTLQLFFEPSITMRPTKYTLDSFDVNIPLEGYYDYDETNPLKVYGSAGGQWWNFFIGRDELFWGTGHTGSLTFNNNSQYFDFARLSFFAPKFKYSFIINQLPLRITKNLFDPDLPIVSVGLNAWMKDSETLTISNNRYYYLHRIDFTIKDRVSIGIMEGVMVGNSPIELKYLNPLIIFHSFFSWDYYDTWKPPYKGDEWEQSDLTGSILSIEVNWNIIKNLAVYGQLVINEFAEPGELEREPNQPPNGIGYLLGIQYAQSFNTWASVFFLEFIYTDPFSSILSSPFASFIQQNHYKQYYYIGYQRDTIALTLGGKFFYEDKLNFSGSLAWIASGEHNKHDNIIWNWEKSPEAYKQSTPSGNVEHKFILSLGAGWKINQFFVLGSSITGIAAVNNRHIEGDNVIGGQVSFSAGFQY